jgi:hypothetical protein
MPGDVAGDNFRHFLQQVWKYEYGAPLRCVCGGSIALVRAFDRHHGMQFA